MRGRLRGSWLPSRRRRGRSRRCEGRLGGRPRRRHHLSDLRGRSHRGRGRTHCGAGAGETGVATPSSASRCSPIPAARRAAAARDMVEPSERGRIEQWLLLKVDRLGKLAHREATGPNREDGKIRGNSFCIYSLGPALPLGSGLRARETPGPSVQRFTAFEAQASESPVVGPSPAPPQTPGSERPLRSDHGSWASGRPSDSESQPPEPGSWRGGNSSGPPSDASL